MNGRSRFRFRNDDSGVSTVLGAVLLLAIITMFLVTIQISFVPRWAEERESAEARSVQQQFISIQSELDRRLENMTTGSVAYPIGVARGAGSIFSLGPDLPGDISMYEETDGINWETDNLTILQRDGTSLAGVDETWISLENATTIGDIEDVLHLRLRVEDPGNADDGDAIELEAVDGNGDEIGTFEVYITTFPSGYRINVKSTDADGGVRHDEGESRFQQDQPAFHWINVLQEDYVFAPLLAGADRPITLNLQENGLMGDFALQYSTDAAGGTTIIGSSGLRIPDYTADFGSGRIEYDLAHQHFPDQTLILEHGALILDQPDGASMLVEPRFTAASALNTTIVDMSFTGIDADDMTYTTSRPVSLRIDSTSALSYTAIAPRFTVNLTTNHSELWIELWERVLDAAGIDGPGGEYATASGTGWARLDLYGTETSPTGTTDDLTLRLRQATVTATLVV